MDVAYDHIQEEVLSPDDSTDKEKNVGEEQPTLNAEFAQAYRAISSTSWGAKLGSLVGTVKKQSESYYEGARQEYTAATSQASKGLSDIINRTRSLSLTKSQPQQQTSTTTATTKDAEKQETEDVDITPEDAASATTTRDAEEHQASSEGGVLSRFRSEAYKRLKEIEKAEEAADEALLKFGTNIRNFLRDAVSIAPPTDDDSGASGSSDEKGTTILYESKDPEGKRVIHPTRFDAQLHVIHSTLGSFMKDPASAEYSKWSEEEFSVERKTEEISADLQRHKELRTAMEQLVPDRVMYEDFWKRYYFLRHVIETEEQRRKEMLKGAASADPEEEEVAWDEDSDTESPTAGKQPNTTDVAVNNEGTPASVESSSTLHPSPNKQPTTTTTTTSTMPSITTPADPSSSSSSPSNERPAESRRSNDQQSHPDSDASYDLISGAPSKAPSHAPGSPKEVKQKVGGGEESDEEEDWE
ncbi:MAG: hypothetical protein M1816_004549 [Peltula sp. TS41687]|nr:MAG: hypothetical protein M1816_004549 [Peltula sp. TS41687]